APTPNPAIAHGHLRAVRIVETQHRGLREDISGAKTGGVAGITLDLRGPAHVTFHQQPRAYTTEWHGGSVEERFARNEFLRRLLSVRDDLFRRELRACGQARKSSGGGHQLENLAASEDVDFVDGPALHHLVRSSVRVLIAKEILVLLSLRQLVQTAPKPRLGIILG